MSALSDLVHIKDRNRNALQNAVIAYDHRPQEAAEILASMQARIEAAEKMAERLRALRAFEDKWNMRDTPRNFFTDEDAAALEAWEKLK